MAGGFCLEQIDAFHGLRYVPRWLPHQKRDFLDNPVRHKSSAIREVTATLLHDGIRDNEIRLPGYTIISSRPSFP